MQSFHAVILFTELLYLGWMPLGYLDSSTGESDTFRLEDYSHWLKNHKINLVNYAVEVGTNAIILSPITPAPVGIRWFSLKMDGELPSGADNVSADTSMYFEEFKETYNTSWRDVFKYDEIIRWVKIFKARLGYADVFRVFVKDSRRDSSVRTDAQTFDVAITLMIFRKHECGFKPKKPKKTKKGDSLNLYCSVIVNGLWNASLIFRNEYDESEVIGVTSRCGSQPSVGTKICSTVKVIVEADILAYSCRLHFPSSERHDTESSLFQNSTWTANFNKEITCTLPKLYLQAIPSEVSFLCNQMPCGDTVLVNDAVTCVAHGYPQPVFDLRIEKLSSTLASEEDYEDRSFLDSTDDSRTLDIMDIKSFEDYRIKQKDVGQVKVTCNVSNELGWDYNSLVLEVIEEDSEIAGEFVAEPRKGLFILCNGKICSNFEVMRIEDDISCAYDPKRYESNVSLTLKLKDVEKAAKEPWLYSLKLEDVGEKLVQCILSTGSGVHVSEISIAVIYAHRYPHGNGIYMEEQPAIVILCQQHECQDNETVDMFQNITCMANSLENEVIEMQLNGVSVGVGENNYTHNIVESPTNGTLLLVVCNTSSDYNDTVSVQIHVGNVEAHEVFGALAFVYDDDDFDSTEFDSYEDAKSKLRDDQNFDDYFSEFERDTKAKAVGSPNSFALLYLVVTLFWSLQAANLRVIAH